MCSKADQGLGEACREAGLALHAALTAGQLTALTLAFLLNLLTMAGHFPAGEAASALVRSFRGCGPGEAFPICPSQ